jgi:hypothetical protein
MYLVKGIHLQSYSREDMFISIRFRKLKSLNKKDKYPLLRDHK